MKTSKLFFLLISVVFFFSACSTPPERIIKYTTSDNHKIDNFKPNTFGEAKIISNEFSEEDNCFCIIFNQNVTEINKRAFSGYSKLTSIEIPNCVTKIKEEAFFECTGLLL